MQHPSPLGSRITSPPFCRIICLMLATQPIYTRHLLHTPGIGKTQASIKQTQTGHTSSVLLGGSGGACWYLCVYSGMFLPASECVCTRFSSVRGRLVCASAVSVSQTKEPIGSCVGAENKDSKRRGTWILSPSWFNTSQTASQTR